MTAPIALVGGEARAWTDAIGRALSALRLNQHFPPWQRLAATIGAMATGGEVRVDPDSGLPTPREWVRVRVGRELAPGLLDELAGVERARLPAAERDRLDARRREHEALAALPELPVRELHVALRHIDGGRASWLVRLDRFDVTTATVARYTLIVGDRPGRHVAEGELEVRASAAFAERLDVLSTQDAALAFAVLRDQQGMDVEEVVRGVVGPAALPARAGPAALRELARDGPLVSACLERASLDVRGGVVDDPVAGSVVVPGQGEAFGVSRQRKWAVAAGDADAVRAWLRRRSSRNLVYPYAAAEPAAPA